MTHLESNASTEKKNTPKPNCKQRKLVRNQMRRKSVFEEGYMKFVCVLKSAIPFIGALKVDMAIFYVLDASNCNFTQNCL